MKTNSKNIIKSLYKTIKAKFCLRKLQSAKARQKSWPWAAYFRSCYLLSLIKELIQKVEGGLRQTHKETGSLISHQMIYQYYHETEDGLQIMMLQLHSVLHKMQDLSKKKVNLW